ICRLQFEDHGLLDLDNVEDTYALEAGLEFILGDNEATEDTEEFLFNGFKKYEDDYVNDNDFASIIIIGEATENIKNYSNSMGQEVIVKQVLRGTDVEEGDTIFVFGVDHFGLINKDKIVYTGLKNLMKADKQYLIFMDSSGIEQVTKQHTYTLSLDAPYFNYLDLTGDFSYPIEKSID